MAELSKTMDHLRVCGADRVARWDSTGIAWITSACAEQTAGPPTGRSPWWDHLRVCGADSPVVWLIALIAGITSACAEQTRHCTYMEYHL